MEACLSDQLRFFFEEKLLRIGGLSDGAYDAEESSFFSGRSANGYLCCRLAGFHDIEAGSGFYCQL